MNSLYRLPARKVFEKAGPLLQPPPDLQRVTARPDACLAAFPPTVGVAVKPRHPS